MWAVCSVVDCKYATQRCPSAMRYAVYQARAEVGLSKTRLAQLVGVVGSRHRRAVCIAVREVSQISRGCSALVYGIRARPGLVGCKMRCTQQGRQRPDACVGAWSGWSG
jgi:hypothetical protein